MLEAVIAIILVLLVGSGIAYVYGISAHINLILFPQIAQLNFTQAHFSRYFITWCWTQYPLAIFVIVAVFIPIFAVIKVALKNDRD